ncbi:MAG: RluA family pseudouridine synthase [Dehalococcoidia bacterium]|nr:RluA family pseudouridine synthase [Dehalococcoidia bacterium]
MSENHHFIADISDLRLDKVASEQSQLSRTRIQNLIKEGYVTVNGEKTRPGYLLQEGDRVDITIPSPTPIDLIPETMPLSVVYEDKDILVIDKPPGLTVHPAPGHPSHTLVNAILAHCPDLPVIGGSLRPGIVHRLDKDTSGLIIVAKNELAQDDLAAQMKARTIVKKYLVLVKGKLTPEKGAIEAPIGRDPRNRQRMAVVSTGRPSRTGYRVLQQWEKFTLVEATLETGRTHQIRVHFGAIGFPVMGDVTYGMRSTHLRRQFVHACYVKFIHPGTREWLELESPLPPDLKQALESLTG